MNDESRQQQRRTWFAASVLLLLTIALYWPVRAFDFITFDDPIYVTQNPNLAGGWHWKRTAWFFQAGYGANWHPLTWFSHALDVQLYGLQAGGPHLTNVVLHGLSAMTLFLLLQRFTKAFWRSALVAALFAWHPLRVESVAWVSERKDCLSCLLCILALWTYLRYAENLKTQISNLKSFYWLALLFFALALMAKPMVVTLPFILLLLDFWPLGRFHPGMVVALCKEKLPFFLLSAAGCVVTLIAQTRGGSLLDLRQVTLEFRIWNAATGYLWYIEKTFWPKDLNVIVLLSAQPGWLITIAISAIILISGLLWHWRHDYPYLLFGWCWYLGTLVPVIGLIQVGSQAVADRYSYIPSIGLLVVLAWGACDLTQRVPFRQAILAALAIASLALAIGATRNQLSYWKNSGTLFWRAVTVTPRNFEAWDALGSYYLGLGQSEEARMDCERSLQIYPGNGWAHENLANALLAEKKPDQAAEHFRLAIQDHPWRLTPRKQLGDVLMAQNKPGEAVVEFQGALRLDPNSAELHLCLAKALARQGDIEGAKKEFTECIKLAPKDAAPYTYLAGLLSGQRNTAEAIAYYQQALRLQPDSVDALNNLAWILATDSHAELRDGKQAVQLARRACEFTHDKVPLLIGTLAASYAEAGRFDEAVAAAQKAHDLALAAGKNEIAAKNLELQKLYRSNQSFHEHP